jgi:hemerythrin-like metal-binding protein
MLLGVPEMDEAHESFLSLLNQVVDAPDSEFPEAFSVLLTHIEHDFWSEKQLMERIDYPGLRSHREQHARVLAALHQAVPAVSSGDVAIGRKALELLPKWFMFHLATMDTALAFALELRDREAAEGFNQMAM